MAQLIYNASESLQAGEFEWLHLSILFSEPVHWTLPYENVADPADPDEPPDPGPHFI